jgi:hypothetical protein
MVQYARYEMKSAPLAQEFGQQFLARRFGQEEARAILEAMPKYVRGPKKGQPKGHIVWVKCSVGGWVRGAYGGRVLKPGVHEVQVVYEVSQQGPRALSAGSHIEALLEGMSRLVAEGKELEAQRFARRARGYF